MFGDNIDTDLLAPGAYMKGSIEQLAPHCLEALDADFARAVRPGDILVAGDNFGIGSSREQAVHALRHLGIRVVLARSFGRIFYRNAMNLGLPVLVCRGTGHGPGRRGAAGRLGRRRRGESLDRPRRRL